MQFSAPLRLVEASRRSLSAFFSCRWASQRALAWWLLAGAVPCAAWAQTGTWREAASLSLPLLEHAVVALDYGPVLVTGGSSGSGAVATVDRYQPYMDYWWGTLGDMREPRRLHTATQLPYGNRVLLAGGFSGAALASAEVYDAVAGTSVAAPAMSVPRARHTATRLLSGDVLIVGGNQQVGESEVFVQGGGSSGHWSPTGPVQVRREDHTAVLLPSGKVLVAGGRSYLDGALTSVEVYDPATNNWSPAGSMAIARSGHTATLLASGQVLVAGGRDIAMLPLNSAELYDPATNTWASVGPMAFARERHTASLLPSGEVLVAGGYTPNGSPVADSAERFNPLTKVWQTDAPLPEARANHTATLVPTGEVLLLGGEGTTSALESAVRYRYPQGLWADAQDQATARGFQKVVLLPSGKVLAVGGLGAAGAVDTVELYDPALNGWAPAAAMSERRHRHTVTLLASGKVLVAGGVSSKSAEVYDPVTDTWAPTPDMTVVRERHTATRLADGRVLMLGGEGAAAGSAEIYDPDLNTWSAAAAPGRLRSQHSAVLLGTGKVLVLGGDSGNVALAAEVYDPATNSWSEHGLLSMRQATLTRMPSGRVLAVGGYHGNQALSIAYVYDPQTGWSWAGELPGRRARHASVLLSNGRVLITGGDDSAPDSPVSSPYESSLLYDESTGTWTEVARLRTARADLALTLLPSGRVLGVGGTVGANQYTAEVDQYVPEFTVTPVLRTGGYFMPVAPVQALLGDSVSFALHTTPGYRVTAAQGCGGSLVGTVYTTGPITANCNVSATFAVERTVTAVAGAGGSITPSGAQVVPQGGKASFTVTPQPGYQIASVTGCGGTLVQGSYTTALILQDCTVTASFTATQHAITAVAAAGGSISPAGAVNVAEGQTVAFTVTPAAGYRIAAVTGCGGALAGSTYTTAAVTAACTVQARFETLPTPTNTGSGPVNVGVVDGSAGCQLDLAGTGPVAAPAPYPGATLPHGAFRLRLINCQPGETVRVAVTFPDLTGFTVKKYGPTPDSPLSSRYYDPVNLQISGNTVTYDVTDGGWGDNSFGAQDGTINDPVVPVLLAPSPAAIPTLSNWGLGGLAALLGLLVLRGGRRTSARFVGAVAQTRF